jgi:predicted MFS family arabinose efflux permease
VTTVQQPLLTTPPVGGPPDPPARRRGSGASAALLLAAVGLVFADASIVALALPDLYVEFETTITAVSWVLTAYALAVAVTAFVLLFIVGRASAAVLTSAGAAVFCAASVAAGAAPSVGLLVAARTLQGIGGAALVTGSFIVLSALIGDRVRAVRWWAAAGAVGAVVGPAVGGAITQLADWRAVFLLQAPLALGAIVAAWVAAPDEIRPAPNEHRERRGPGALTADVALALTFGALVGALFLGVILLVVVWGLEPIVAAAVVTALPIGTVVSRRATRSLAPGLAVVAGGALLAGGLATMGLLPAVNAGWVAAALALCGLGFGLLANALGPAALPDGGGMRAVTLSTGARHLGLVLGLAVIAPVLSGDIMQAAEDVSIPATAVMLDAPVGGVDKVQIAVDVRDQLRETPRGEVPDFDEVFARNGAGDDPDVAQLQDDLETTISEVLTRGFRDAFLVAAGLAALSGAVGLVAIRRAGAGRGAPVARRSVAVPVGIGLVVVAAALPATAIAAGGTDMGSVEVADPCLAPPDTFDGSGFDAAVQRFALSGLNGAACELGVSREELILSFEPRSGVELDWDRDTIDDAIKTGVQRAIDDADERGSLPGWIAGPLRGLVGRMPVSWFLGVLGID